MTTSTTTPELTREREKHLIRTTLNIQATQFGDLETRSRTGTETPSEHSRGSSRA